MCVFFVLFSKYRFMFFFFFFSSRRRHTRWPRDWSSDVCSSDLRRKKWRDVHSNAKVAFVVDDLASVQPWAPRGIEIRGTAEVLHSGGKTVAPHFDDEMFRISPRRIDRKSVV